MKTKAVWAFFLTLFVSLQTCAEEKKIAICIHGIEDFSFLQEMQAGVKAALQNYPAQTKYYGLYDPEGGHTPKYIAEAIADKPDGLIVSLEDPIVLEPLLKDAIAKGIRVIAINAGYADFARMGIQTFIGEDPIEAGYEAGKRLLDAGVTKLLCVRNFEKDISVDRRIQGLQQAFSEKGKSIKVTTVRNFSPATASAEISTNLVLDPEIDGICSIGASTAVQVILALRQQEIYGQIKFATFDFSSHIRQALQENKMLFAVSQQVYMQGFLAAGLLVLPSNTDIRTLFDRLNEASGRNFFPIGTKPYQSYENPGPVLYTGPIFITPLTLEKSEFQ